MNADMHLRMLYVEVTQPAMPAIIGIYLVQCQLCHSNISIGHVCCVRE